MCCIRCSKLVDEIRFCISFVALGMDRRCACTRGTHKQQDLNELDVPFCIVQLENEEKLILSNQQPPVCLHQSVFFVLIRCTDFFLITTARLSKDGCAKSTRKGSEGLVNMTLD